MLNRYLLQIKENSNTGKSYPLGVNDRIAITDDGRGIAPALVTLLKESGYRYAQIAQQISPATDVLIILDGLTAVSSVEEAISINRRAFLDARIVAERFTQKGGLFITVQDTGGQFGFTALNYLQSWTAGLTGLTKTAALEWPKAVCQAIDLQQAKQSPQQIAARLLQQILHGNSALEYGLLTDGRRIAIDIGVSNFKDTASIKSNSIVHKDSVLVAAGGGRGITAACLIALARQSQPKIVLLGRTTLSEEPDFCRGLNTEAELKKVLITTFQAKKESITPAQLQQQLNKILAVREIKTTIATLEAAGSEVMYADVDLLNAEELKTTLNQVRQRWKKITGIIHGAGVLADKYIAQKTEEQFDKVFNTKVYGLKNLLEATKQDKLDLILFFSSVAARFGNFGQSDYAMANEILNKVAQYEQQQRGKHCLVKSFNWGPWESGMVTPLLKALFTERGIDLLPMSVGTQMFLDELQDTSRNNVEVVLGGTLQPQSFTQTYIVNEKNYPFLHSHVVENIAVIPACLVLEWFIRTAKIFCADLKFVSCQNFKVLRGILLPGFHNSEESFSVHCEYLTHTEEMATLSLRLLSAKNTLHYSAQIVMQSKNSAVILPLMQLTEITPWPWPVDDIYQSKTNSALEHRLFHGKELQAIQQLKEFSPQGGSGQLATMQQKSWNDSSWQTDLLILDGALQLLRLWTYSKLKHPSLPTQIAEFVQYSDTKPTENVICLFNTVVKGKYHTISNVLLTFSDGRPYASLRGVEMYVIQINEQV